MNSAVRSPVRPAPARWWDNGGLEVLPTATCVCDADGFIVEFNSRARELWGRSPRTGENGERYCGSHRLYSTDGRLLPHARCPMADVLKHGTSARDQEIVIERPNGDRITALLNIDVLRDDSGVVIGAINCFLELPDKERHIRELLHALPAAVYTTDREGRITFYNEAAAEFWGQRPTLGESWWCGSWRLYRPDGSPLPHDQCPMALALKQGRPIRNVEAVVERPDGSRVQFMPYPTPLHNAAGEMIGAVNMLIDIGYAKQAEKRQQLLINELNHRVKNTLTTVQSIARQTLRNHADGDASKSFESRLLALAKTHDVLTRESWAGADIHDVVTQAVAFVSDAHRIEVSGPTLRLPPKSVVSLAMAVHELCTNALKYGALSDPNGRVSVRWHTVGDRVQLRWVESDGPPVRAPASGGFGRRLLERGLAHELKAVVNLAYPPSGVTCDIEFCVSA